MRWKSFKIVLVLSPFAIITTLILGAIVQGFSFPLTQPFTMTVAATVLSSSMSSDNATTSKISVNGDDETNKIINEIRARLNGVVKELKKFREEVGFPSVKRAINNVIESLEDVDSLLKFLETTSPIPNEARTVINETLSSLKKLLDELRDDIEALREAKMTLTKIEAVAGTLADKAFEKAKSEEINEAEKLARKALNITNGVINAYYRKAQVFETYAIAFKNICEALAELIRALTELVKTLYS